MSVREDSTGPGVAPVPESEKQRLEELRSYGVLDTLPEQAYDDITFLASQICDTPIALVSLVDADRQWFKSRQGLHASETPREHSFCAHAILGDDVMLVTDALADSRFSGNPLVTGDPKIRFYAGAPIVSPNGHKLGALCVIDREPRTLTEADVDTLRDLAEMVEQEMAALHLATTDGLTGLSNRRAFLLVGQQVLKVAERMRTPVTLVFADLDDLKQINDRLGHAEGDRALSDAARLLAGTFRGSDVVARIGGDEFCVMFTATSGLDASKAMTRLQAAFEEHNANAGRPYRLSLSLGYVDFDPAAPSTLEELMERADRIMYANKRSKGEETPESA